jgi:hypothetical protein
MCRVIEHRGPDDEGYHRAGEFGMGMGKKIWPGAAAGFPKPERRLFRATVPGDNLGGPPIRQEELCHTPLDGPDV